MMRSDHLYSLASLPNLVIKCLRLRRWQTFAAKASPESLPPCKYIYVCSFLSTRKHDNGDDRACQIFGKIPLKKYRLKHDVRSVDVPIKSELRWSLSSCRCIAMFRHRVCSRLADNRCETEPRIYYHHIFIDIFSFFPRWSTIMETIERVKYMARYSQKIIEQSMMCIPSMCESRVSSGNPYSSARLLPNPSIAFADGRQSQRRGTQCHDHLIYVMSPFSSCTEALLQETADSISYLRSSIHTVF